MSAPRKNAFTLIELLVVISIIALLVSILLPALNQARDISRQLVCSTHLKSIYLGLNLYAEGNKGIIPKHSEKSAVETKYTCNMEQCTYFTYIAYDVAYPKTDGDGYMPFNFGRIYDEGVIETPESFYCPSLAARDTNFAFEKYTNSVDEWGQIPSDTDRVRVGYTLWRYWRERVDKLDSISTKGYSEHPLCYDTIFTLDSISHRNTSDQTPKGLNVLWGGGHVTFVKFNDDILEEENWGQGKPATLMIKNHREVLFRIMGWEPKDANTRLKEMGWIQ